MSIASLFIKLWTVNECYDTIIQQTAVFTTLCFLQLGNALSVRSAYHSLFASNLFANRGMWGAIILTIILQLSIVYVPILNTVFKTATLTWPIMMMILIVTLAFVLSIETLKLLSKINYLKK
jgi:Ca2+-transporting ATPase